MRNIPGYPADTDVLEPVARVVHRGVDREVSGLSLSRELPSSFHEQVRGIGGITQATGSVDWSARSDVVESHPTGFNRVGNWPPRTRDTVDVFTGYRTATGDLLAKQLTGFVSKSSGDPLEGFGSGLVDLIARLDRKVNLPPLLPIMPPLVQGGDWRGIGLYPTFFTDFAARAGRFYSTPPMSTNCVFSAPLMGSAWPERGTLVTGRTFSNMTLSPAVWQETPWGMGCSDAYLVYSPSGTTTLNRPMEITAMTPPAPFAGWSYIAAVWGSSNIQLRFTDGIAAGQINGITAVSLSYVEGNIFTLRVVPSGGTMTLTLRDAAGREATTSTAILSGSGNSMTEVRVASETAGALIGGAQVAFPPTAWVAVNYERTAFITPAAHNATLRASPAIIDKSARSILEEQSTAELAALWFDGDGNLQWKNRDRLVSDAPVLTLTSKDHLLSLPWEEDFAGVASRVEVKSRIAAAVTQFKHPRVEVWRSNYGDVELDGTEVFEEVLHPDADEDWIMVDTSFNNDFADNRAQRGSDVRVYYLVYNGEPGETGVSGAEGTRSDYAIATLEFMDHRTYKLTTRVLEVSKAGYAEYEFSLKIPSKQQIDTGLDAQPWRAGDGGESFPVVRAFGKVRWADITTVADAGVWDAPVLTHDVGWYVQDPGALFSIANLVATNTTTPRSFLRGVSIVPDARLQLGDIVTLSDPDLTGISYRCLVVGLEDSFTSAPTTWEQTCNFRVLSTTTL